MFTEQPNTSSSDAAILLKPDILSEMIRAAYQTTGSYSVLLKACSRLPKKWLLLKGQVSPQPTVAYFSSLQLRWIIILVQ
jgi:hypothetical protein